MTERAMTMPHGTFVSGWRQIAFVSSDLHARNEMLAQVRETAEAIVNGILRGFTLQLVNFPQSRHFQPHFSMFFQTPLGTYIALDCVERIQNSPEPLTEVIEMRSSTDRKISTVELIYFLIGVLLLLLLASITAKGLSEIQQEKAVAAHQQIQQPLYTEYRGVRLGMSASEVRAKLGEPALKSDEQDFYVLSDNETTQIAYDARQRIVTISTDYKGGVGAPDYRTVVGEDLLTRPDGSMFRMVRYESERFWVSYNKSASVVPVVTITIGALR